MSQAVYFLGGLCDCVGWGLTQNHSGSPASCLQAMWGITSEWPLISEQSVSALCSSSTR